MRTQRTPEMDFVFMHTVEFTEAYYAHCRLRNMGIPPPNKLARYRAALEWSLAWYKATKRRVQR